MLIANLLKLLNEQHVHDAVIGAQACAAHGYVCATRDKGVDTREVLTNKIHGEYEGVPTSFVSWKDLISMKKAAGRPKDVEDLRYLEEIKRQKEKT